MTIEELIKELEKFPKDLEVVEFIDDDPIIRVVLSEAEDFVMLIY